MAKAKSTKALIFGGIYGSRQALGSIKLALTTLLLIAGPIIGKAQVATSPIATQPNSEVAFKPAYKQENGKSLRLFIWRPAGPYSLLPALIFFHGGGWHWGKPGQFGPLCKVLLKYSVVCISVEYSLQGGDVVLRDAQDAFNWVRTHHDTLGLDPRRIAAGGGSVGGYLAASLAILPSNDNSENVPNALILLNPLLTPKEPGPSADLLNDLRYPLPPTLVLHGTSDHLVPFKTIEDFVSKARRSGSNHIVLTPFLNRDHGFFNYQHGQNKDFNAVLNDVAYFLAEIKWIRCGQTTEAQRGTCAPP